MNLLANELQLLAAGILLAAVACFIGWLAGFFQIAPQHSPRAPALHFSQIIFGFLLVFGLQLLVIFIYSLLALNFFPQWRHNLIVEGWIQESIILLVAFFFWLYCRSLGSNTLRALFGKGTSRRKDFLIGFSALLIAIPITVVVSRAVAMVVQIEYQGPHVDQDAVRALKAMLASPPLFITMALLIAFIVPAMEEMLFRGLLQTWLSDRMSRRYSIPITALIFVFFHLRPSQGIDNFEIGASLFTLACFLGYVYERQQSLWASISLHGLFNTFNILLIARSL
jgi:uncharacterized protein